MTGHGPPRPWTKGIPLLHPWANRLGGLAYGDVELDPGSPDLYFDPNGLPLHGLRSAATGWETAHSDTTLSGRREFAGLPEFPFDHTLTVHAELDDALTITTTLTAGPKRVPVAFGYHPFFVLPGVPRAEWEITLPVAERLELDDKGIPTGKRAPAGHLDGPLGARTFDDGFTTRPGAFVLAGGGRRIALTCHHGYPYAQLFAPAHVDVVCFEPMTAPADALRHSPGTVAPGEAYEARFSVSVSRAA